MINSPEHAVRIAPAVIDSWRLQPHSSRPQHELALPAMADAHSMATALSA